ncbi:MAG: hypothetical protein MMC33_004266 [Icmadophila ericetorum]|nr:hypothetical protein [Icmadophila ericetorum]
MVTAVQLLSALPVFMRGQEHSTAPGSAQARAMLAEHTYKASSQPSQTNACRADTEPLCSLKMGLIGRADSPTMFRKEELLKDILLLTAASLKKEKSWLSLHMLLSACKHWDGLAGGVQETALAMRKGQTCKEAAPVGQVHADVAAQHNEDLLRVWLTPRQQCLALVEEQQLSLPHHLQQHPSQGQLLNIPSERKHVHQS